jgi:TonB-linked SusC/RagA family outer membrane protein
MKIKNLTIFRLNYKRFTAALLLLLFNLVLSAQNYTVKGKVSDQTGAPLIGITVLIKGTKMATVTDFNGTFQIKSENATGVLAFSAIGYKSKEVDYSSTVDLNVTLGEVAFDLSEAVVVGYGSQEKRTVSASMASANIAEINSVPTATLSDALAGKMAGVMIENPSNDPGSEAKITIRGNSSIRDGAANSALIVIDGVIGGDLSSVNPNDIESLQVLKDAASASIYGSRGANGVIIVTTKAPSASSKLQVDYNSYFGVSNAQKTLEPMNSQTFVNYAYEGYKNRYNYSNLVNKKTAGGFPTLDSYIKSLRPLLPGFFKPDGSGVQNWQYEDVDWRDIVLKTGYDQRHTFSFSGTANSIGYRISFGYTKQDGIVLKSGYDRYNGNAQFTFNPFKSLKLIANYTLTSSNTQLKYPTVIRESITTFPMISPKLTDGTWSSADTWQTSQWGLENTFMNNRYQNPLRDINLLTNTNKLLENKFALNAVWTIYKSLLFNSSVSYTFSDSPNYYETLAGYVSPFSSYSLLKTNNFRNQLLQENFFTYNLKNQNSLHQVTLVAGNSIQRNAFLSDAARDGFYVVGSKNQSLSTLVSFYSRLNYNYDYRYMFTATYRADASSRFGIENRWGFFPSASAAWSIANEQFFKNNISPNLVSTLKLKASRGTTGNENIPTFNHLGIMKNSGYIAGDTIKEAFVSNTLANRMLGWEITEDYNLGLESGFFKNRISFLVEGYNKQTTGLLFNAPVPAIMGHGFALQNVGSVENKGFEVTLTTRNVDIPIFKWTTNLNVSVNNNKVLKLGNNGAPIYDSYTITEEGQPMGRFLVLKVNGIYQKPEDIPTLKPYEGACVGNYIIEDVNKDGRINILDRVGYGNPAPKFTYGIFNTITFFRFTLGVQLTGAYGNQVLNANITTLGPLTVTTANQWDYVYKNSWSPDRPDAKYAAPMNSWRDLRATNFFSNMVEDGSFIRLQTVSLAYDMSNAMLRRMKLRALKLILTGQNLYTFTRYSGIDPQAALGYGSNPLRRGVDDYSGFPLQRTFSVGINLNY